MARCSTPQGVLYGRLPGYGLSSLGHRDGAGRRRRPHRHASAEIGALISSPLQRTQQSADPMARVFDLDAALDDRVIEPENRFEGKRMSGREGALRDVRNWAFLVNPWEPSWGEPFGSIARRGCCRDRTTPANATDSGDAVIVSHQLPIWMVAPSRRGQARSRTTRAAVGARSRASRRSSVAATGSSRWTTPTRRRACRRSPSTWGRCDAPDRLAAAPLRCRRARARGGIRPAPDRLHERPARRPVPRGQRQELHRRRRHHHRVRGRRPRRADRVRGRDRRGRVV